MPWPNCIPQIVVKVPMIKDGVKAIKYFTDKGIRTNCTLVFSPVRQFWLPKQAQHMFPRLWVDSTILVMMVVELIQQIVNIYTMHGFETEVLAASVRSSLHIVKCAEAGADVVTCPLEPILGLA
jgi:transaldolase